jgi:hypothetical protein
MRRSATSSGKQTSTTSGRRRAQHQDEYHQKVFGWCQSKGLAASQTVCYPWQPKRIEDRVLEESGRSYHLLVETSIPGGFSQPTSSRQAFGASIIHLPDWILPLCPFVTSLIKSLDATRLKAPGRDHRASRFRTALILTNRLQNEFLLRT